MGSSLDDQRALHPGLSVPSNLHAAKAVAAFVAVAVVGVVLLLLGTITWPELLLAVVVLPALLYAGAIRLLDGGG
jgi:hypothetical protein